MACRRAGHRPEPGPDPGLRDASANALNPETISLAALVLGMLLIALVSIGGFTVLAQRRLRSIGMLESLGATDRNVSLVVRANGVVVGFVGAIVGFVLSLVLWLAYRPSLEQSAHHLIGVWALPWAVVALSMVLAVVATYFAASRPARAITKVPIVAALSGRPASPETGPPLGRSRDHPSRHRLSGAGSFGEFQRQWQGGAGTRTPLGPRLAHSRA